MQMTSTGASMPWLANRPRLKAVIGGSCSLYRYLVSLQWIVDLVRWMITTGGNVAESAFLLATVYVTVNVVAHTLVAWVFPLTIISSLNQVSVIAFSVLPELIVAAAIKVTFDQYKMAWSTKRWDCWVWAVLYTLPTAVFLWMTIVTITSFVSLEAVNVNYQASGSTLIVRCLAGWSYGMLQTLFVALGKDGYAHLFHRLRGEIAELGDVLKARDTEIAHLTVQIATLTDEKGALQNEVTDARLAMVTKKVAGTIAQKSTITQSEMGKEKSTSAAISEGKKEHVKKHFRAAILSKEKVNYRKIATEASVSYNTVRRHAKAIIEELMHERETEKLEAVGA